MIRYHEDQIQTAKMALNQLKVEGTQQARVLILIDNILNKGIVEESGESMKNPDPEAKEGE